MSELKSKSETQASKNKKLTKKLTQKVDLCNNQSETINQLQLENKKLHRHVKDVRNEMADFHGRIRVFCRIRPLSVKEMHSNQDVVVEARSQYEV